MQADIVIVGAGPVGLCLARALSGQGLRIVVVERQRLEDIGEPRFDGREIALTQKSVRLMQKLGLWDHIEPDARSALRSAKVFNGASPHALDIGHELSGHSELGWLVSNHLIRKAAYDALCASNAQHEDVTLLAAETVSGVKTGDACARVTLESGKTLTANLIVAADSRFSATRKMMGIPADLHDYGKAMLVCRMTHEAAHGHAAWEWFGYDQTLALLPLNADRATHAPQSSVVLTLPVGEVNEMAALSPEAFSRDIERRFARRLGAMTLTSTRHVYPLVSVYPERFVATRFAAVGDAAVGMHPVTAHGFNFGLLGVETLGSLIVSARGGGLDIGAASVLRRYEDQHRRATRPLFHATRFITDVFTNNTAPARFARDFMLRAASRLAPFRRAIAASLTG
ncbi:5-demethoxyubiquinol-8 5-hydroxylase UbiM [Paraburkholderia unamae]|uniref:Ubiquinone biosynthesis UbiH/UbiF/VisC/COQ6 family hydroxylase n=1 Tax=Paraburkholderia unamae TaxID=219649 RepID=A0ABX5KQH7_9BURK|nr:5-demethoxyubiquinol-8 5-hydroxylase UbiM [Paraburkholderia unamae]PVX82920.1 ubiquinone biosynthesis UbiH/UbiF/VisC/COQ6 family hydroxylase [Paraburkholderia unamae]CAG9268935.1 2-octaprenyl-3-methyl-6-methoxy-1,4-benzoquinol hydroxylase [Paraburkholderia unamae]